MTRALSFAAALLLASSLRSATLSVSVNAQPSSVNAGQVLTVAVQVDNGGSAQMNNVSTSVQVFGSGASAGLSAPPSPLSASISPFSSTVFTWIFNASGCGSLSFSAYASAYDSGSALTVTAGPSASNVLSVTCFTATPSPVVTPTPTLTATPTAWIVVATATPAPLFGDASVPGNLFHPDSGRQLSLNFNVPVEGTVEIDLYNRVGARVKHFELNVAPGSYSQLWDGRDEQGSPVASGIYVAQFKGKGLFKAVKLAVVK